MHIQEVFKVVLSLSLMGSGVAVVILILKRLFRNRLAPAWHYYIWVLLVLRLTIPYTPQISTEWVKFPAGIQAIQRTSSYESVNKQDMLVTVVPNQDKGVSHDNKESTIPQSVETVTRGNTDLTVQARNGFKYGIAGGIWFSGVVVVLIYFLIVNTRLRKMVSRQPQCKDIETLNALEECRKRMGISTSISIIQDPQVRTPFLFGFIRPKLLLSPVVVDRLTLEEIRHVLYHELVHIKRGDVLINWIFMVVQALHWFNPLIWYSFNKMRQDCEISCDAQVLEYVHPKDRLQYGQTIINLIKAFSVSSSIPGTAGMTHGSQVKRRILMISKPGKKSIFGSLGAAVLTVVIATVGLLAGCSEKVTPKQENPILSQPAQNSPTATPVDKQKAVLEEFDGMLAKNATLIDITRFLSKNISSVSSENASRMVLTLEEQQKKYLSKLEEKFEKDGIQKKINEIYKPGFDINKIESVQNKDLKDLLVETRDSGYRIETAEGMYFPIIHYEVYKNYGSTVTPDIREYIEIMSVESNKVPLKDAALVIPWEEVLNRAFTQEKFLSNYKNSVRASEVSALLKSYSSHIFFGTNNTPLFSYENKMMIPEAKAAYQKASASNTATTLAKALNGYMELLKKNDYKLTEAVDKYRKDTLAGMKF